MDKVRPINSFSPSELPEHLRDRVSPLGERRLSAAGDVVVYWMHHAVRADENPALEVASCAASALRKPLLVYQGLSGRHPYNSDRHHTFILEGARDVAQTLERRGVRHVLHLPRRPGAPSPLLRLTSNAALVVTEDFPAPPFPAWTARLFSTIACPVWRVDSTCLFPMRLAMGAFERAFEFRKAHGQELARRASLPWPDTPLEAHAFEGDVGFEPVDLASADIAELCAGCDIDHAIGPVPGTRGGSGPALDRWNTFLERGLDTYDRFRNDAAVAPPLGVSRLSPYLHHGQLSPFRVAREASKRRSRGAEKFLDELLIWRELAHNFCLHQDTRNRVLGSLEALPAWAQESLSSHAEDPREAHYDWERLSRAKTGDALWDAAQRSLLVHGELHNNLRMTWGKAFLGWTRSAGQALDFMNDLNHRYALDGSDPNSYAGLLYCLGLFDRPFKPEKRIYGAVRPRSTRKHLERLDLENFRVRMNRRAAGSSWRIGVVGAGISGLAAARTLADQGFEVQVFERARGVGGRAAHRRTHDGAFDHGAQYFTVRDPRFQRYVQVWQSTGIVERWRGRLVSIGADGAVAPLESAENRYVGVPGMTAVAKHLARDLDVIHQQAVTGLAVSGASWRLSTEALDGHGPFDAILLAMPPEQASRLSVPHGRMPVLDQYASLPCWCAMVAFDEPLPLDFDGAFIDGDVAWAARDSTKPGRPPGERWVIHAGPTWSATRLEDSPDAVAWDLLQRFFRAVDIETRLPVHLAGHRWSFARSATPAGEECLWRADSRIACCGDWCLGGRIEGAYLSGVAAAGRVVGASAKTFGRA